jgi:hypothetical protein
MKTTATVVFCNNCMFYKHNRGDFVNFYTCQHPKSILAVSSVNKEVTYSTCMAMRIGSCGEEAKLFEQRKPWWRFWQ